MRFSEWVGTQPHGTLKRIERELRIGYTTLGRIMNGAACKGSIAKKISLFTGGQVTVEELVCPAPREGEAAPANVANPTNTREVRS